MKRALIWPMALAFFWVPSAAYSQNPFAKPQESQEEAAPRGRFFRKLREEITGQREDTAKEKKTSPSDRSDRQGATRESAHGLPTPLPWPKLPNPFASQDSSEDSTRSGLPPFRFSQSNAGLEVPGRRSDATRSRQNDLAEAQRDQPQRPPRQGFGMKLREREEGLFVDDVDPRGNAQEAQLKRGDRIVKVGGVEVETQKQFDEIAGLLGNGDQIELVIARRGKESSLTLQFGQPPAAESGSEFAPAAAAPSLPFEETDPLEPSSGVSDEIADFAPPRYSEPGVSEFPAIQNENSILERSNRGPAPNGFRQPSLPARQTAPSPNHNDPQQLIETIQQQQQVIRQLQQQIQVLERQRGRR